MNGRARVRKGIDERSVPSLLGLTNKKGRGSGGNQRKGKLKSKKKKAREKVAVHVFSCKLPKNSVNKKVRKQGRGISQEQRVCLRINRKLWE